MTFVFSMSGLETGLFSITDTLVSTHRQGGPPIDLPLHEAPISFSSAGGSIVGMMQKLVIVSPTIVASWAGSAIVARALLNKLRRAGRGATIVDLDEIVALSGLADPEVADCALIVHQLNDGRLRTQTLNAEQGDYCGVPAAWAGTGTFDFLHDLTVDEIVAPSPEGVMRSLMTRLVASAANEASRNGGLEYMYGGWFEILISRTGGLRKLPYAVKFWGRRGMELGHDAPMFFSWYRGSRLFVCAVDRSAGNGIRTIEVPPFLSGTRSHRVDVQPRFDPEFSFNVVHDLDGSSEIYVSDRHSAGHLSGMVRRNGDYELNVRRELIDLVMSRSAAPAFKVQRASEPD